MTTVPSPRTPSDGTEAGPRGRVRTALAAARDDRSRWPFLDGARGVAMVAVFAFHALRVMGDWYSPKIRAEGVPEILWGMGLARFAIDVFFVLSGFLIAMTWWSRRERLGRLGPALRDYTRRRAFRILPVFWLSLLVLVPLRAPDLLASPKHLGLLVSVQQYLEPGLPDRFNTVTWSLTTEMHFYLLVPLLAVLVRRRVGALALLAGTVALTVWWFGARGDYSSSLIFGRLDQFVVGMIVADVYGRHAAGQPSRLVRAVTVRGVGWFLGAVLLAVGVYHGTTLGLPRGDWFDPWQHPVAGLALGGLGLRLLCGTRPSSLRRVLERPWFLLIGAMSYSLYLWHLPILETVFDLFEPLRAGVPLAGTLFAVGLSAVLAFGAAALSYTYVELPFMRRKSKRAQRREREEQAERDRERADEAATRTAVASR